jgi:hypothetical protein
MLTIRCAVHRLKYRYSYRTGAIAALDGRSVEYRYYKKCRDDFLSHVGGEPTAIQRELVEQAAWLKVRLAVVNRRLAENDGVGIEARGPGTPSTL